MATPFEPGVYTTEELVRIYGQGMFDLMMSTGLFVPIEGRPDCWTLAPEPTIPPDERYD